MTLTIWAKSPARDHSSYPSTPHGGKEITGYPLLPHLLDVAAVASRLQKSIPCPVELPCSEDWISALVGLHDLGKATPGFQRKLGLNIPNSAGAPDRHDASTVPLLMTQLKQIGVTQSIAHQLSMAVGAHHGSLISSTDFQRAGLWQFSSDWLIVHNELFDGLLAGIGVSDLPDLPDNPFTKSSFLQWMMGLTTVADWIGSSDSICRWERLEQWAGNSKSWFASSIKLADQSLTDVGITSESLTENYSGAKTVAIALNGMKPRPLQDAIVEVIDSLGNEPGLVVIEAPMGEGKTEGGLAFVPSSRGLYMAMPTQATSNALFGRVSQFVNRAVSGSKTIVLAHGAGGPNEVTNRLREIGLGTNDSAISAGWWFRGSKRSLLCPFGIGTVDQSLIGVLNTKHQFVRMFGLTGRTVVFDELHAYDSYTGGLIERLINWLQCMGCTVVIMSATLPNARRDTILQAWAGEVPIPVANYPRVSWAVPGRIDSISFPACRKQILDVRSISADRVVDAAVDMAQQGARVLMVVNKVARAQAIYQAITDVPCSLFHARFPMDQRLVIEQCVLKQFGPSGNCRTGHVLVATQVAEQSLDIDMDVLITDIAPVDLILQRAGRIHRHDRKRPDKFRQPCVLVAGLDQPVPPNYLTSYIYDQWTVLRSVAWLKNHNSLELPEDIDLAVQQVYGKADVDGSDQLLEMIAKAWPAHIQEKKNMEMLAQQAALHSPKFWDMKNRTVVISDDDADAGHVQFGTRLGQPSITVVPLLPDQLENLNSLVDFLAGHYLRISNHKLIAKVRNEKPPPGWNDHPGLRHHLPLFLDVDGVGPGCRLDQELGLVFA